MANFIILLCVIPLVAGVLSVPLAPHLVVSRVVGVISLLANLLVALTLLVTLNAGVLVSELGNWPAPFSIAFIFDSLAGMLIAASAVVALACYIHGFSTLDPAVERRYYHPLFHMLIFGVNMCFLTGDLFNLFVAFEIALMASYALMAIGATPRQLRQTYKYVVLNLLASTLFVMGAGMTYGMFGTLNIAHIAHHVAELQANGQPMPLGFTKLGVLLLTVFAVKGAFFPLWFWLPDTYYTAPIALGALFSGLLTKVGVYCVMRTYPLIFSAGEASASWIMPLLAISAAVTMFLAVLGAVSQSQIRRILSIHVISQVGYMIFAIAVMSGYALAGAAIFIVHNMVVKSALFLCCGIIEKHRGTDHLDYLGGLLRRDVLLAVMFFIAAMSLVGLPPLSGFFGKFAIVHAGWQSGYGWLVMFALATSPLTLLSMLKIWSYGFWNPQAKPIKTHKPVNASTLRAAYLATGILVVTALGLGLGAELVFRIALVAGEQLADPQLYIDAVLPPELREQLREIEFAGPLPESSESLTATEVAP